MSGWLSSVSDASVARSPLFHLLGSGRWRCIVKVNTVKFLLRITRHRYIEQWVGDKRKNQ